MTAGSSSRRVAVWAPTCSTPTACVRTSAGGCGRFSRDASTEKGNQHEAPETPGASRERPSQQGRAEMIEYGELRPSYVDVEVVAESTLGEIRFFSGLHASPRIGQHITVTITTPEDQ